MHASQTWIELGGTGIRSLPDSLEDCTLRWRGVAVDPRVVFEPETLTADDVFRAGNVEQRRVMVKRIGYERFLEIANARELDRDTDRGGERRLLRIDVPPDEPLVCVSVTCPSTQNRYFLRVPPHVRTCHEAVAWTAGYDNPDFYNPIVET